MRRERDKRMVGQARQGWERSS